ncbi:MAG: tetratricopeptide repeat protein [Candidatus Solibacter sp.]|nr:tetratricopeptide repeat protein [Candidatus Solibacter sp.]
MSKPQAPRNTKTPDPTPKVEGSHATPAVTQLAAFEAAMKLFHTRQLIEARVLFQQAAGGAQRDVAQRAQLHVAMCDHRLQQTAVSFGTAEECYNYGVALINARNVTEARAHLEKALTIAPGSDHIHYALALAQALSGDFASAHENLRRAIELDPRNRQIARQDADFAPLAHQAPFRSLLYPEKMVW